MGGQVFDKIPGPFDEQQSGFGRTMVHDAAGQYSSSDVGLVSIERKHPVNDVRLLDSYRPAEHRHDAPDEVAVAALAEIVHGLDHKVTGDFRVVILVAVEGSVHPHGLRVVDRPVSLPNPEIKVQQLFSPLQVTHRKKAPGVAVLVPDVGHVVVCPS